MPLKQSANGELRRSFGWRSLAAVGGLASTFLLSVVVVRSLAAQEAATFFAILAALSFGPKVGCLGMGPNLIRLITAEPDPIARRQIAGTHIQATLLLTGLSAPLIALVGCNGLLGHDDFLPVFIMATFLIAIESVRLLIGDIFAAAGRVRASVASMHYVRSLLVLPFVALVLFAVGRPSLLLVVSTFLAVSAVHFAFTVVRVRHDATMIKFSDGMTTLRRAISQGAQLSSLDLAEFLVLQGTIWLATATLAPEIATQYAAAVTLAMQVTVLESLAALSVAAPAGRLWAAGKKDQVVRMLSNNSTLSVVVVLVVVAVLAILGPFALELAYGPALRPAAAMLLVIAIGGIFQAFCKSSIILLIVSGHIGAAARTATILLIVAVPAAVAAVLLGGPIALAIVTSLSIASMSLCQFFTARKVVGVGSHAHFHVIRAVREIRNDPDVESSTTQVTTKPRGAMTRRTDHRAASCPYQAES